MATRVGINGFGRIGRSVFRILSERDDINVVCINDLFENEQLAYLLKYDTVMGIFKKEVTATEDALYAGDQKVVMTAHRDPAAIPWKDLGVDVVIESTGVFRERAPLEKHLTAGAKKVLLTVPAKEEIDATIVLGVNDDELKAEHRIVSNASCTTNCLAPIAKIIDDSFGLEEGFITTVHAYTNDQRLADVPHKDFRRSRAAGENIIPTTTGAARAVGKVVDLVCRLGKNASAADVNGAVREAAEGPMQRVLEYSEEPLVSSDIIGNPHSSIFDAMSTNSLRDGYLRVVSWYDNEWGYSNRVVDLIEKMATL
jgi:glyceraldehyde 3-phosphate dehydrogenase